MQFLTDQAARSGDIAAFFHDTFAASDGAEEGRLIGDLSRRLMAETPAADLHVFGAEEDGTLLGVIVFSRLVYPEDPRAVFLMAPVGVKTDRQGQGIGQALITHGLGGMRKVGADVAVTYGDPKFYGRTGFRPVTEAHMPAPYALQYPEGWQAQSLTRAALTPFTGPAHPVPAFADPVFW